MSTPEDAVAAHLDRLLSGQRTQRREVPAEAAPAIAAANRLAAGLHPDPDPVFVGRLHHRLERELGGHYPRWSRRRLLVAGGAAAAAAVGLTAGRGLLEYQPRGRLVANGATWRFAAQLADLPEGSAVPFATESMQVLLVRSGGEVRALSATCTHLGCRLQPAAGAIACPCHRTRFALDGQVLEHQLPAAPPALPEIPVRVAGGRVEVLAV